MTRIRRFRAVVDTTAEDVTPPCLTQIDLLKLDGLRSRWERIDLVTQLAVYKIDEVTRKARSEIAVLSAQLERDIIARQKARDAYEQFRKEIETRYKIDLSVVSYDDETGKINVPVH